jgi:hypothetical protein
MNCLICKDLMRVLKSASTDYRLARSAPFFLVSTEIAAQRLVDMERAKIAVSEHLLYCESVDLGVARSFLSTHNAVPAMAPKDEDAEQDYNLSRLIYLDQPSFAIRS